MTKQKKNENEAQNGLFFDAQLFNNSLSKLNQVVSDAGTVCQEWNHIRESGLLPEMTADTFQLWMNEPELPTAIADKEAKKMMAAKLWPGAEKMIQLLPVTKMMANPAMTGRQLISLNNSSERLLYDIFFNWDYISFKNGMPFIPEATKQILTEKCTLEDTEANRAFIERLNKLIEFAGELGDTGLTNKFITLNDTGELVPNLSKVLKSKRKNDPDFKFRQMNYVETNTGQGNITPIPELKVPANWVK
jgi:hypothetical protein